MELERHQCNSGQFTQGTNLSGSHRRWWDGTVFIWLCETYLSQLQNESFLRIDWVGYDRPVRPWRRGQIGLSWSIKNSDMKGVWWANRSRSGGWIADAEKPEWANGVRAPCLNTSTGFIFTLEWEFFTSRSIAQLTHAIYHVTLIWFCRLIISQSLKLKQLLLGFENWIHFGLCDGHSQQQSVGYFLNNLNPALWWMRSEIW